MNTKELMANFDSNIALLCNADHQSEKILEIRKLVHPHVLNEFHEMYVKWEKEN